MIKTTPNPRPCHHSVPPLSWAPPNF